MSLVAGIDVSTKAIDCVWVDEDPDGGWQPKWERVTLEGQDAWERTRSIAWLFPRAAFEETLAIGVEVAHGMSSGAVNRAVGAVLARLPRGTLVKPWTASEWKKANGIPGNAEKDRVAMAAHLHILNHGGTINEIWPQDACDAYCIALATRSAVETSAAA